MILELVGLPGAGKTACESFLQRSLEERGFRVVLPTQLQKCYVRDRIYGKYKLNYGLRRFLLARAVAYFIYRLRVNCCDIKNRIAVGGTPRAFRKYNRLPCQWLAEDMLLVSYYRDMFSRSSEEENIYLSSEGLTHLTSAVTVWAGERYGAMSKRWMDRTSCEDLVVLHVRTSVDTALQRMWERGAPRSWPVGAKATKASARTVLLRFEEAINQSIEQFHSSGAHVFSIDNSEDITALSRQVTEFVKYLNPEGKTMVKMDENFKHRNLVV